MATGSRSLASIVSMGHRLSTSSPTSPRPTRWETPWSAGTPVVRIKPATNILGTFEPLRLLDRRMGNNGVRLHENQLTWLHSHDCCCDLFLGRSVCQSA